VGCIRWWNALREEGLFVLLFVVGVRSGNSGEE